MTDNRGVDRLRALVLADDDEHRSIERALHDGAQQQLIALAVRLQIVRALVHDDPQEAVLVLDELRDLVGQTLAELRGLAGRVHPPLLDSQGLVAALRMAADAAPFPTSVQARLDAPVPPEVAVTVYRCWAAMLAGAEGEEPRAAIDVRIRNGALEFEIALTGAVVSLDTREPLAVRTESLGGTLELSPARVVGRLPLES